MNQNERDIQRKLRILKLAEDEVVLLRPADTSVLGSQFLLLDGLVQLCRPHQQVQKSRKKAGSISIRASVGGGNFFRKAGEIHL